MDNPTAPVTASTEAPAPPVDVLSIVRQRLAELMGVKRPSKDDRARLAVLQQLLPLLAQTQPGGDSREYFGLGALGTDAANPPMMTHTGATAIGR